jgi:hypothetical protein
MAITYAQLKAMLDIDEPDYALLAEKASGAMAHLLKMAQSDDPSLASKAVSLAGFIGDDDGTAVVSAAAKSRNALVRVAAAHAANLLPDSPQAARVISKLVDDTDLGVAKFAARASARQSDLALARGSKAAQARVISRAREAAKEVNSSMRSSAMAAKQASKSSAPKRAPAKSGRKAKSKPGEMPVGDMASAPKGVVSGAMPTGKMR